jgi:hypothetical protein
MAYSAGCNSGDRLALSLERAFYIDKSVTVREQFRSAHEFQMGLSIAI